MGIDNTLLTVVTSGALAINTTGDTKEIYSQIVVLGSATETTNLTINCKTGIILPGGTILNIANIRSLNVVSGAGVLVRGIKLNTNI